MKKLNQGMKKLFQLSFILMLMCTQNTLAQEVKTMEETINGTELSMAMDSRVAELLSESEEACKQKLSTLMEQEAKDQPEADAKPKDKLTIAEICRQTPRLSGFKIQVAVVHDRQKANEIRYEVRRKFPDLRTELDSSLRPNYRILAGSYFSRESGSTDLRRVRKVYSTANLVPYRIFCAESK